MNDLERGFAARERTLAAVRRLLTDKLQVRRAPEEIDPDTPLFGSGLRLDSIDAVDLWVNVRAEFGLADVDELRRVQAMRTPGTLVDLVLERRGAAAGSVEPGPEGGDGR
jgi:acyl carrier protein